MTARGTGCPKNILPRLGGCFVGVVDLITQLHSPGLNLELETSFESISKMVADLWQRRGKVSGCL